MTDQQYQKCIDACLQCATECNSCAVSCLEEKDVQQLTKCIRLDLECAVICRASAEILSLGSSYSKQICHICEVICNACADECEKHAAMGMEHCKECAEVCRLCSTECRIIFNDSTMESQSMYQNESAILSRLASELMSLGSVYCNLVFELNELVHKTSSDEFDKYVAMEMQHSKEYGLISQEAHKHFLNQNKDENPDSIQKNNEQPVLKTGTDANEKKHHSVLLGAASLWRSPVNHALAHVNRSVLGTSNIANTGTIITYKPNN